MSDRLAELDPTARRVFIEDLVRTRAAAVLGHRDPDRIEVANTFLDIGFDSLTVLELHDALSKATGVPLPTADAETPAALTELVLRELKAAEPTTTSGV